MDSLKYVGSTAFTIEEKICILYMESSAASATAASDDAEGAEVGFQKGICSRNSTVDAMKVVPSTNKFDTATDGLRDPHLIS